MEHQAPCIIVCDSNKPLKIRPQPGCSGFGGVGVIKSADGWSVPGSVALTHFPKPKPSIDSQIPCLIPLLGRLPLPLTGQNPPNRTSCCRNGWREYQHTISAIDCNAAHLCENNTSKNPKNMVNL